MARENPWAPWRLYYSTRDGLPTLTATNLWHLAAAFPDVVERVSDDEVYVHLDRPYRVRRLADRDYMELLPAPDRAPPEKKA
jgi:hypothetical protein